MPGKESEPICLKECTTLPVGMSKISEFIKIVWQDDAWLSNPFRSIGNINYSLLNGIIVSRPQWICSRGLNNEGDIEKSIMRNEMKLN